MRAEKLRYCVMMSILLSSCIDRNENDLTLFETEDGRASIAISDEKFYINPVIQNGLLYRDEIGRKISYYRDKKSDITCHNFGNNLIIAEFKTKSEKCFGWRFEKNTIGKISTYNSYCDEKNNCIDEVFRNRPFLRYLLNERSELIQIRFDPTYEDSINYVKKGEGKYFIK